MTDGRMVAALALLAAAFFVWPFFGLTFGVFAVAPVAAILIAIWLFTPRNESKGLATEADRPTDNGRTPSDSAQRFISVGGGAWRRGASGIGVSCWTRVPGDRDCPFRGSTPRTSGAKSSRQRAAVQTSDAAPGS